MVWVLLIVASTLFVAYANGANDNFKGVATLFGSRTARYRVALAWATLTTFLGSLTAFFLAKKLILTFSGKGLVPDAMGQDPAFLVAVIAGAAFTVFFAARVGIPISTTHSLTGALAGGGFAALGMELGWGALGKKFFIPLLVSPFIAVALTAVLYLLFRGLRGLLNLRKQTCVCVGEKIVPVGHLGVESGQVLPAAVLNGLDVFVDDAPNCEARAVERYMGRMFGLELQKALDFFHFLSAGAVSFARGLNDTPKIVALSVAAGALELHWNILTVAVAMAAGGVISARRVADTMSHRITPMTHGQGLTANMVTAFLVLVASRFGVPVSTTHVSCGSLFGIGLAGRKGHWGMIHGILGAWILTLPVAAVTAGLFYWALSHGA